MNGTIKGNVKVITGQSGQAWQFNGTNSSVQNYAAAPFTSNLTLSAWINTTNAARDEAIIARYNADGPATAISSAPMRMGILRWFLVHTMAVP